MDKRTLPNDILLGEVAAILDEGREAIITPTGNPTTSSSPPRPMS